jgi:hypothetical protein
VGYRVGVGDLCRVPDDIHRGAESAAIWIANAHRDDEKRQAESLAKPANTDEKA